MMRCKRCGTGFNLTSYTTPCPACGVTTDQVAKPASINASQSSAPLIPMEDPEYSEKPFIALIDTILECITRPTQFFSKITNCNNQLTPIIFSLVLGSVGVLATFAWMHFLPQISVFNSTSPLKSMAEPTMSKTLLFAPFFMVMEIFAISAYIHIIFSLFRKKRSSFLATFRMVCYTESSALLLVIPYVGTIFSLLLHIFLILTGVQAIHQVDKVKSLFFLSIIPLFLLFLFLLIIMLVALAIGVSAGSTLIKLLSIFVN